MDQIKSTALHAIRESGKIIRENVGKIESVNEKRKNDFVTNIDIEAENTIKDIISASFPDHTFTAEESATEHAQGEYTWFIDPVSSTVNYVHGFPHFATVLALQKGGEIVLAYVLDPLTNELFFAEKGKGAFCNDQPIHVSSTPELGNAMVILGIHMKGEKNITTTMDYVAKMLTHISDYRRIGSTALQLCYVACGRADAYTHNSSDMFAVPAGKLILEEAGGKLTDFSGATWKTTAKNIIGSNSILHEEIIQLLQ